MTGEAFPDRFKRWYGLLPPALRMLMTVNTVLYVVWVLIVLIGFRAAQRFTIDVLALTATGPDLLLRPWQLVTYGFLHLRDGLWGFIAYGFNMLWLYWIGREYEEVYGSHRLFGLYVLATVGGGLLILIGTFLFPAVNIPVAGALAAVLGVLCGVATLNPNRGMGLFLLGVVPIKWIAIGFLVLAVLFFAGTWPYMFAYLGASAVGFGFARAQMAGLDLAAWARPLFRGSTGGYSYAGGYPGGGQASGMRSLLKGRSKSEKTAGASTVKDKRSGDDAATASKGDELDRLLDKINAKGYESLTKEEKQTLYEASRND